MGQHFDFITVQSLDCQQFNLNCCLIKSLLKTTAQWRFIPFQSLPVTHSQLLTTVQSSYKAPV